MKCLVHTFDELTNLQLYEIMRLRQDVFVVEQRCLFTDLDGRDITASHLLLERDDRLVACCRILPPTNAEQESEIGRFVVPPLHRREGLGHELMKHAVRNCRQFYPGQAIRIRAQSHLIAFYEQHGFCAIGQEYVEDGIPHTDLVSRDFDV